MNEQNELIQITLLGIALFSLLSFFIVYFVLKYKQKQHQHEQEKAMIKSEKEKEVAKAKLEISEDILKKISLDIHDNIGQSLSVAKLSVQAMNVTNLHEQSTNLTDILTRTISDLRNLSKTLNGNYVIENGLIEATEREIEMINKTGKIHCTFEHDLNEKALNDNNEVILFRCIQEAMNNAMKHANATELLVEVKDNLNNLAVKVQDNGNGMSPDAQMSIGMKSMSERTKMMGGHFEVKTEVGKGTTILFKVPFNNN